MAKIRPTLFIGLGDLCSAALAEVENMLCRSCGSVPPMVGFISIAGDEELRYGLELEERLSAAVNNLWSVDNVAQSDFQAIPGLTEVQLIAPLADGSDSVSLLRFARMLKKKLTQGLKISGYALMPDAVYDSSSPEAKEQIYAKAYATILDLDYLRSEQTYEWPFDALYFIGNRNLTSYVGSRDALCRELALALFATIFELGPYEHSLSDNVHAGMLSGRMSLTVKDANGISASKEAWIASLGASEITFDAEAVARLFMAKAKLQIIDRLSEPCSEDVDAIVNEWLNDNHIHDSKYMNNVLDYFMSATPPVDLEALAPASAASDSEEFFSRCSREPASEMDRKLSHLRECIEFELISLIAGHIICRGCLNLVLQILGTLIKQVQLADEKMGSEIASLNSTLERSASESKSLLSDLNNASGLFQGKLRRRLCDELCSVTKIRTITAREIQRRELARAFYSLFIPLLKLHFQSVHSILSTLDHVRAEVKKEVDRIFDSIPKPTFFREDLTREALCLVRCTPEDIDINDFFRFIEPHGGIAAFASASSDQIDKWLGEFASHLPKTEEYRSAGIEGLISELAPEKVQNIVCSALAKARPLILYDFKGFKAVEPEEFTYCSISNRVPDTVRLISTGLKDRIIILQQLSVLPAFALVGIEKFEAAYQSLSPIRRSLCHSNAELYKRIIDESFSIWPVAGNKEMSYWLKALIFGLLSFDYSLDRYVLTSKALGGSPGNGFRVPIGENRFEAFRHFARRIDDIRPEIDAILAEVDNPGPENLLDILPQRCKDCVSNGTYLEVISKCPIPLEELGEHPEEQSLLKQEMDFALRHY